MIPVSNEPVNRCVGALTRSPVLEFRALIFTLIISPRSLADDGEVSSGASLTGLASVVESRMCKRTENEGKSEVTRHPNEESA